ncbi:MAG: element excision factor XisH family protein [Elainellaceae cyanobacterium]
MTHDPFPVDYGDVQMQIDLGAERLLAAERGTEKIAVEVKSFTNPSAISEFHTAVGQYLNYRRALRSQEPTRILYLAIPNQTYDGFFRLRFVEESVKEYQLYLIVYDVEDRRIVQWIK